MSVAGKIWKTMLATSAGIATLAAVNAKISRNANLPDEASFGGDPLVFEWKHGRVLYKAAGEADAAAPIVFVHGVGAGASNFMWRRNFDALARDFRVLAPDLPGFGLSDKSATAPYSADFYTEFLADFLRATSSQPAHIVASSLGAAFSIRVADEHPELIDSLVLVSPTGADNLRARPGMTGAAFYGLLHSPVLGTSFYNAVTSERSIRDYARKHLFYERRFVTPNLVAQYYGASHQSGAQHAIAAFLSGYLNTDIRMSFARLRQPITLVWGQQDEANPVAQASELLRLNPNARLKIFDHCRMMPQEEHAQDFNEIVRETFRTHSSARSTSAR
jgi:pimeloyl-ACP methyl ester carboxylesterase